MLYKLWCKAVLKRKNNWWRVISSDSNKANLLLWARTGWITGGLGVSQVSALGKKLLKQQVDLVVTDVSPRGGFLELVVAWVEKVDDSPCCPFLAAGGIIHVNEELLTAQDLLSSADTLQLCVRVRSGLLIDRTWVYLSLSTNYD